MAEHSSAPSPHRDLLRGHGELILVVDDEEAIRAVAHRILTRYGYKVVVAANGVEALQQYDEHHAELAAIITDVSMPDMDGPALIAALRERKVAIPIIVSSGYIPEEGAGRLLDTGTEFFISKPFSADGLLSTLRGVLVGPD